MNTKEYDKEIINGRGAQTNPVSRFSAQQPTLAHWEGIDELPTPSHPTQFYVEHPKQIVNKVTSPDLGFAHSVNPYQGCEHGCVYCYARNVHEYWGFSAGLDFESKIIVKKNAAKVLEKTFNSSGWKPSAISLSGNTDCYQPAERKYQLTRQILEVCLRYGNPVGIITKNSLILRDLDILKKLAKEGLVHVYISLTTLNEDLRRKLEPRTTTAKRRLQTVKELTEVGIPVGVMTAPLIPSLNHHEVFELIKQAAEHGAVAAGHTVVRLNGQVGPIFETWLRQAFPDRADKVLSQIRELHGGTLNDSEWGRRMRGQGPIADSIHQMAKLAKQKFLAGRSMPSYNLQAFRRNGQIGLF
jgi:DNA repair photolyase